METFMDSLDVYNNNLCYIKNIIVSEDEKQEELIKTDLKYKVDENLFDIPDDYAEAADF